MAGKGSTPTFERTPSGLSAYWAGVWRHALKTLKAQGSWAWEQRPLLDEYVYALIGAEQAREGFRWLDAIEPALDGTESPGDTPAQIPWDKLARIAGDLPVAWDRHAKRAAALADQLALTPRGRKAVGLGRDEEQKPTDPFAALDASRDELAKRRARGASSSRSTPRLPRPGTTRRS